MRLRTMALAVAIAASACGGRERVESEPVVFADGEPGRILVRGEGFRNDTGRALIALYNTPAGFPDDGDRALDRDSARIRERRASTTFAEVTPGRYAVSVLHDENQNLTMDTGLFGVPEEGYGVSNNVQGSFGPPEWDDAVFTVRPGAEVTLTIDLIYH